MGLAQVVSESRLNGLGRVSVIKIFVSFIRTKRSVRQKGLSVFEFRVFRYLIQFILVGYGSTGRW